MIVSTIREQLRRQIDSLPDDLLTEIADFDGVHAGATTRRIHRCRQVRRRRGGNSPWADFSARLTTWNTHWPTPRRSTNGETRQEFPHVLLPRPHMACFKPPLSSSIVRPIGCSPWSTTLRRAGAGSAPLAPGQAVLAKCGWGLEPYLRRTFHPVASDVETWTLGVPPGMAFPCATGRPGLSAGCPAVGSSPSLAGC